MPKPPTSSLKWMKTGKRMNKISLMPYYLVSLEITCDFLGGGGLAKTRIECMYILTKNC